MKIICLEEHAIDLALAEASQPAQRREAAYLGDLGSRVRDRPERFGDDRPRLRAGLDARALATELGGARLDDMDANGIDMQVLSYSNVPQLLPAAEAVDLTRAANDRLAEAVRAHPTRYAGLALLPWQAPEAAARELERAVTMLDLKGSAIIGRPGETFLDDPRYARILAAHEALRVPLYVHPGAPLPQVQAPYYAGFDPEVSARLSLFGWGWHNEAGIHVIRLILAGVFERFPSLQVISGHWGEMVPFYLQRMDDTMPPEATGLSHTITDTYRAHVFVTPSGMLQLPHFAFIRDTVGIDRILFSVDYPYLTNTGARRFLETLPVDEADRARIAHGNAEALLRL